RDFPADYYLLLSKGYANSKIEYVSKCVNRKKLSFSIAFFYFVFVVIFTMFNSEWRNTLRVKD
ncbi:hypothetical protein K7H05_54010, partial [Bacillus sp. ZZQ-131]